MNLFPHQVDILNQTADKNRVTIKGYEGLYEVDIFGNVYSLKHGLLKPWKNRGKRKDLIIGLCKCGKVKKFLVSRLIAEAFIPNTLNLPQVNHKDGNIFNNHVDNLEWCTNRENTIHAYKNHLRKKHVIGVLFNGEYYTLHSLCEKLSLNYKNVFYRYKYSKWDIMRCLNLEVGDKNHVEVISTSN